MERRVEVCPEREAVMLPVRVHPPFMTVSDVAEAIAPTLAVIFVGPAVTPVTTPVAGPTVAIAVLSDIQSAMVVMFAVVLSEYVPVAVSCEEIPTPAAAGLGVMASD